MTKPRVVYLGHGFNVSDRGVGSILRLRSPLESYGFNARPLRYGWWGLILSRFGNAGLAQAISDMSDPGDAFIAHSNGCDVVRRMSFMEGPSFEAVLINPALDCRTAFGPRLSRALVVYNKYDWAVWAARWLIAHPWGAMGRWGYKGRDHRISSIDAWKEHGTKGHSGIFRAPEYWAARFASYLEGQEIGERR